MERNRIGRVANLTGRLVLGVLLGGCGGWVSASENGTSTRIEAVEVGLGGQLKVGYWLPLRVAVSAGANGFRGQVVVEAADGDGAGAQFMSADDALLELAAGERWTGWRYVKLGRLRETLRVSLRTADGRTERMRSVTLGAVVPSRVPWVVAVGQPAALDEAARMVMRRQQQRVLVTKLTGVDQFPDRWFGYEGVDVLIVCTGQDDLTAAVSDRQFAALRQWLEFGGRLVLSAGQRVPELFADESRLALLRPGDWEVSSPHWRASGLEAFAGTTSRLLNPEGVSLPVWDAVRGRVICTEGGGLGADRPLITQYPFGFGQVTYLAFDLDLPPVSTWAGQARLLARLIEGAEEDEELTSDAGTLGQVTHVGFDDLAGQLHGAMDQFADVGLFHFSWVAGLVVLYLIWIGPVDFFVLRRWGRPHWTWLTFPLAVLVFSGLAVYFSHAWKGGQLDLNQAEIVDVDLSRGLVRGTTWANMYSPRAVALDLELSPRPDLLDTGTAKVLLSWQGLPGRGLGGMSTTAAVGRLTDAYQVILPAESQAVATAAAGPQLCGLPVHTSSSKQVLGRWWWRAEQLAESQLTVDEAGFLRGEVVNPLGVELERCAVYYQNWMYPLERRLAPGAMGRVGSDAPVDLKWQLTRRRLVDARDRSVPWDRTNLDDVPRILEMLMFHEAAGGRRYTQLADRYQGFLDLSEHLRNGRAILVGQIQPPPSELQAADRAWGATRQWAYCRIVMPVSRKVTP